MKIVYSKSAEKEILKLDKTIARRIFLKISLLEDNPFSLDSQKLAGGKGYRIRIGDYRVIYTVHTENSIITITKIAHRKEVYR